MRWKTFNASFRRSVGDRARLSGLDRERRDHGVVVRRVAHDRHALVVFRRAAQHRRTADIDVLDRFLEVHAGFRHGLLERIKIHHDEIDQRDVVFLRLRQVVRFVAAAKEPAMDFGMQRFHAAFHDFGKAGVLADFRDRQSFLGQKLRGASRGEQSVAVLADERSGEFHETAFVRNGKEGEFGHTPRFLFRRANASKRETFPYCELGEAYLRDGSAPQYRGVTHLQIDQATAKAIWHFRS